MYCLYKNIILFLIIFFCYGCDSNERKDSEVNLIVLGVTQDGGFPQANCEKSCCKDLWRNVKKHKMITSLGFWDKTSNEKWMIELTPDFKNQLKLLN